MAKECTLSAVKLPLGGLPSNIVAGITGRPDMTSAVYRGRKANSQTNKTFVGRCPRQSRKALELMIQLGIQLKTSQQ